jgi:hypothetical protein
MATLRELIIKVSADSGSFQREIARASRMGQDYYRTMQNGGRQAASAAREREGVIRPDQWFRDSGASCRCRCRCFCYGENRRDCR